MMDELLAVQLVGKNLGYELAAKAKELVDEIPLRSDAAAVRDFITKNLGGVMEPVYQQALSQYSDLIQNEDLMDALIVETASAFNEMSSHLFGGSMPPVVSVPGGPSRRTPARPGGPRVEVRTTTKRP